MPLISGSNRGSCYKALHPVNRRRKQTKCWNSLLQHTSINSWPYPLSKAAFQSHLNIKVDSHYMLLAIHWSQEVVEGNKAHTFPKQNPHLNILRY